jgi:hypothetical protein
MLAMYGYKESRLLSVMPVTAMLNLLPSASKKSSLAVKAIGFGFVNTICTGRTE